jgi:hypothetical protein
VGTTASGRKVGCGGPYSDVHERDPVVVSRLRFGSPPSHNASSGAYGIVQSLPASKMATAGADWQTNYQTQIKWGLDYIKQRYGSPSAALAFHLANNWY